MKYPYTNHQARIFSKYLIGELPSRQAIIIYEQAVEDAPLIDAVDKRLIYFATEHPKFIGLLDSALAFIKPYSELRRRLYVMFAILESSPEYANYFLPVSRGRLYLVRVGLAGLSAAGKIILGTILIKLILR